MWRDPGGLPAVTGGAGWPDGSNTILKPLPVNKQGQSWKPAWAVTLKPDGLQQYHQASGLAMREGAPLYTCGCEHAGHERFP